MTKKPVKSTPKSLQFNGGRQPNLRVWPPFEALPGSAPWFAQTWGQWETPEMCHQCLRPICLSRQLSGPPTLHHLLFLPPLPSCPPLPFLGKGGEGKVSEGRTIPLPARRGQQPLPHHAGAPSARPRIPPLFQRSLSAH